MSTQLYKLCRFLGANEFPVACPEKYISAELCLSTSAQGKGRFAMLMHDIGKMNTITTYENSSISFYGDVARKNGKKQERNLKRERIYLLFRKGMLILHTVGGIQKRKTE